MIEEIREVGFNSVELNFSLTAAMVDEIFALKRSGEITVTSLHNMCPLPAEIDRKKPSPDYYSLSSEDEIERKRAVAIACITIDNAVRFGSRAVVLHAGRVDCKDRTRELAALVSENKDFVALRDEMIAERQKNANASLANVIRSLEDIVSHARKAGVSIGIENRYYYREIPIFTEFEEIFRHFSTGELYYWHDVGHAEVFDRLGIYRHTALLNKFSDRLLGIHLHDIIGPIDDHKAPGQGTFDFSMLRKYLTPDTIKVLEVHQPVTAGEIHSGVAFLKDVLGDLL